MAPYLKVLLMGLRKSGKSSIYQVLFKQKDPYKTTELPTTVAAERSTHSYSFLRFDVWDYPGQNDPLDHHRSSSEDIRQLLQNCGVIVFVLDCREAVDAPCARLVDTIVTTYTHTGRETYIEVFLHKVDVLSEDYQVDLLAYLQRRVEEELRHRLPQTPLSDIRLSYNLTSIYDHSVFHAFSLVVQRLITSKSPYIKELLQWLNNHCHMEASFLFLKRTKIFLSMETQRSDLGFYDLCSDAVEVLGKFSNLYNPKNLRANNVQPMVLPSSLCSSSIQNGGVSNSQRVYGNFSTSHNMNSSIAANLENYIDEKAGEGEEDSDIQASLLPRKGDRSVTYLDQGNCIYVRELPDSLTIAAVLKTKDLQLHKILIDENIKNFYQRAIQILRPS